MPIVNFIGDVPEIVTAGTVIGYFDITLLDGESSVALSEFDASDGFNVSYDSSQALYIIKVTDPTKFNYETAKTAKAYYKMTVRYEGQSAVTTTEFTTINVTDVNEKPDSIGFNPNTQLTEGYDLGGFVGGQLSSTDPDGGAYGASGHKYSLVTGQETFYIDGSQLVFKAGIVGDYEVKSQYGATIRVTDSGGLYYDSFVQVSLKDLNEQPTGIKLSSYTIAENSKLGDLVGNLTTVDQDKGQSYNYTLLNNAGGMFRIGDDGKSIVVNGAIDFETAAHKTFTIRVKTTDNGNNNGTPYPLSFEQDIVITTTDVNEKPTAVALSWTKVAENSDPNTIVGTLMAADPDIGETFSYTLSDNAGGRFKIIKDTDNLYKVVVADKSLIDYEAQSTHEIGVWVRDSAGNQEHRHIIIQLTDANDKPTDITLSKYSVAENTDDGVVVATLAATDQDVGDTFTYNIVSQSNGAFALSADNKSIVVANKSALDYETATQHTIKLQVTDKGGLSFEKTVTIDVTPVNEKPVGLTLSNNTITENVEGLTEIGTLTGSDLDKTPGPMSGETVSDTFTYSIAEDLDQMFDIIGDKLVVRAGAKLDFEKKASHKVTVQVKDQGGLTFDKEFTIYLENTNDKPTDIYLTGGFKGNGTVDENSVNGTVVGLLNATDQDYGDTFTYALVGDGAGGRFALSTDGKSIVVANKDLLNYEDATTHKVKIRVTDKGGTGLSFEKDIDIQLNNANERPTGITLSNNKVDENAWDDSVVAILDATDPDNNYIPDPMDPPMYTYTLVGPTGGRFYIEGNELRVLSGSKLDYESATKHTIKIRVTDTGGLSFEKDFDIEVNNLPEFINQKPTDITLSNDHVLENAGKGTLIGLLDAVDPNKAEGDTFHYEIVGTSDLFQIADNNKLQVKEGAQFDLETQSTHTVKIKVTDRGGLSYEKDITIHLDNVNEKPFGITLSNNEVNENLPGGVAIGVLGALDHDAGDTFDYEIAEDLDNMFQIVNGELRLAANANFDYETKSSHEVKIRVTDHDGLSYEQTFVINVKNLNDAPHGVKVEGGAKGNGTVDEFAVNNTVVGNLIGLDQDVGDTFTYQIVGSAGGLFKLSDDGTQVLVADGSKLDYNKASSYTIKVRVTDQNHVSRDIDLVINVNNVNDRATDIKLSPTLLAENAKNDTVVGTLSTTDRDVGDTFTYKIVTDSSSGAFGISADGTHVVVVDGSKLDYETATQHTIKVEVTDKGGLSYEKEIVIKLVDIDETDPNDAPTGVNLSNKNVVENATANTVVGTLSAIDPDKGNTFTYKIEGDSSNGGFALSADGTQIVVADGSKLDFETATQHTIKVKVTDQGNLSFEQEITIRLSDINEKPTSIDLTNTTIAENAANNTFIGLLSATDPDAGNTFSYKIVGDTSNGGFKLSADGKALLVADGSKLDFETATQHKVKVLVTDQGNLSYEQEIVIDLTDLDENQPNRAPTDLDLSNKTIAEESIDGTVVGTLSATDPDTGNTFTYKIVGDGAGGRFKLGDDGKSIVVADGSLLDFETATQHTIKVQVTDQGGLTFEKDITIDLTNINENDPNDAPTNIDLSASLVDENSTDGTVIGQLTVDDPDVGDTFTYEIVGDGAGGRFKLGDDGKSIVVADGSLLDFETATQHTIKVKVTDHGGLTFEKDIVITLNNANDNPTGVLLSQTKIAEGAVNNTVVGLLTGIDQDAGSTFTFTLEDDAGGRFKLDNDTKTKILVADGSKLDYETATKHTIKVRVTDNHGGSMVYDVVIDLTNIDETDPNDAPTDLDLSNKTIAEGSINGTVVGLLSATDPDQNNTFTYEIVGDGAGGRFKLSDDKTQIVVADGSLLDFETATQHTIKVKVTDQGGLSFEKDIVIDLTNIDETDPNDAPTDLDLSVKTIDENTVNGTVVGLLSATDPDQNNTFTYEIVGDGAGGRFKLSDDKTQIVVADGSLLDFETATQHTIKVKVTDQGGLTFEKDIVISLTDKNERPTGIDLSNKTIAEGSINGTVVGALSATDPDTGDTFTYEIVGDGAGGRFALSADGKSIVVANGSLLDFETATQHTVKVRVTDGNLSYEQDIVIDLTNIDETDPNDAPTDLDLSVKTIDENTVNGTVVGLLSATDPDQNNTFTYEIVGDGAGGRFALSADGKSIVVADGSLLDFETATQHTIKVKVTDQGGLTFEKDITIDLTNANDKPTGVDLSNKTVAEGAIANTYVGLLKAVDQDTGDTFTYELIADSSNGGFKLDATGTKILVANGSLLDFETATQHTIKVRVTDSHNQSYEQEIVIDLTNIDETDPNNAPTDLDLSVKTIDEDAINGTVVGLLSATDPDQNNTFTYEIVGDGAGGRFALSADGKSIVVADASLLDYETATQHTIKVRVTDQGGLTFEKDIIIDVGNKPEGPVNQNPSGADLSNKTVAEGAITDTYVGLLSATDPDTGDTFTYELVDDAGGRFKLDSTKTRILVADGILLDYETATQHTIKVRVTDNHGGSAVHDIVIDLTNRDEADGNDAPTDVDLSNKAINENSANGAVVGILSAIDPDLNNTFNYVLVDGAGGRFKLSDDWSKIVVADGSLLDFEAGTQHTIRIKVTDQSGLSFEKNITIDVGNVNENPSGANLSNKIVAEGAITDTYVGLLSALDPDAGSTFTYELVDDAGGRFKLDATKTRVLVADGTRLDYETATQHTIKIRVTDADGGSAVHDIVIDLTNRDETDTNDAPTDVDLSIKTIDENSTNGTVLGLLSATDPDLNNTFNFVLTDDAGGRFALSADGTRIVVANGSLLDYETATQHTIRVKVIDQSGLFFEKDIIIGVGNVAEGNAPTDITLSDTRVREMSANNTPIGAISITDVDPGDVFAVVLKDDAGGRFKLSADGTRLLVANGIKIDREQKLTHEIVIEVTDKFKNVFTKSFTINVRDLGIENVSSAAAAATGDMIKAGGSNDNIAGGKGDDQIYGAGGNDTLNGGDDNDVLSGGIGNDRLTGGANKDIFIFDTRPNATNNFDTITDFSAADDVIHLQKSGVFAALGIVNQKLSNLEFYQIGTAGGITDKTRIIYNKTSGELFYDADGNKAGGVAAVKFAVLSTSKPDLTADNFFVI